MFYQGQLQSFLVSSSAEMFTVCSVVLPVFVRNLLQKTQACSFFFLLNPWCREHLTSSPMFVIIFVLTGTGWVYSSRQQQISEEWLKWNLFCTFVINHSWSNIFASWHCEHKLPRSVLLLFHRRKLPLTLLFHHLFFKNGAKDTGWSTSPGAQNTSKIFSYLIE